LQIWYHSEPSEVPYSPNQFLGWDFFWRFLKQDGSKLYIFSRVSVQGVKSLGGHFACLCWGFDFYEVKKKTFLLLFFKKKREILLHF
jgi:hypothetical protein